MQKIQLLQEEMIIIQFYHCFLLHGVRSKKKDKNIIVTSGDYEVVFLCKKMRLI